MTKFTITTRDDDETMNERDEQQNEIPLSSGAESAEHTGLLVLFNGTVTLALVLVLTDSSAVVVAFITCWDMYILLGTFRNPSHWVEDNLCLPL